MRLGLGQASRPLRASTENAIEPTAKRTMGDSSGRAQCGNSIAATSAAMPAFGSVSFAKPLPPFELAASIAVSTAAQAETDQLWNALLADGGQEGQCAWLTDRVGVSWQVVPDALPRMLGRRSMDSWPRFRPPTERSNEAGSDRWLPARPALPALRVPSQVRFPLSPAPWTSSRRSGCPRSLTWRCC